MNNNTTTTTTVDCKNIFNELVNGELLVRNTIGGINIGLVPITKGIVASTNCKYCCPTCGDLYYFGSATLFPTFIDSVIEGGLITLEDLTLSGKLECCINTTNPDYLNLDIPIPNPNDPDNSISAGVTQCTNSNFNTCLQNLQSIISASQYQEIMDIGIIEYSQIGSSSMLCKFITQIQQSPLYTPNFLFEMLKRFLQPSTTPGTSNIEAIVIECKDGLIMGGSYESWLKLNDIGGGAVPASPQP